MSSGPAGLSKGQENKPGSFPSSTYSLCVTFLVMHVDYRNPAGFQEPILLLGISRGTHTSLNKSYVHVAKLKVITCLKLNLKNFN